MSEPEGISQNSLRMRVLHLRQNRQTIVPGHMLIAVAPMPYESLSKWIFETGSTWHLPDLMGRLPVTRR